MAKICPLLMAAWIASNTKDEVRTECSKSKCAWWVQYLSDKEGECAIVID